MSSPTNNGQLSIPLRPKHPKAAVFMGCDASHVFSVGGLQVAKPSSDEVAQIPGDCPQCRRKTCDLGMSCGFCHRPMLWKAGSTQVCGNQGCWFWRTTVENNTAETVKLWRDVYRFQANGYLAGDEWKTPKESEYLGGVSDDVLVAAGILMDMSKGLINNGK